MQRSAGHPRIRAAVKALHGLIARSRLATRIYLVTAGALLRALPAWRWKQRVVDNLMWIAPWPDLSFGPREISVCTGCKIRLIPHTNEFDLAALLSRDLGYEQPVFKLLHARLRQYSSVIEIGANVGAYTCFLGRMGRATGLRVVAFEPSPKAFSRLLENLKANGLSDVEVFNAAIAPAAGFLSFYEPDGHLTNGSLSSSFAARYSERVAERQILAIDPAWLSGLLHPAGPLLLKIDVEGLEPALLESMQQLISRFRPDIVVEVLPDTQERLNALAWLHRDHELHLITDHGLEPKAAFEAHPDFRDYFLLPRRAV
jgi:FkbM family methyltransferase